MIVCSHCYEVGGSHTRACPRSRRAMVTTTTPTTIPALVHLDQADQALAALLAWRAVDIEHGSHSDTGWMALMTLRDAADRIAELSRPGGAA